MKRTACCLYLIVCVLIPAHAETLRLATVNWEPFYGDSLPEKGFFSAINVEAFRRAGYDVELSFTPWKRALESAKHGHYDGLLGAFYNEDRARYFAFTDIIYTSEVVFVKGKQSQIKYNSLEDLKFYRIGGLRSGAPIQELAQKGFSTDETTGFLASIKKLAVGRIDLLVIGKAQFVYAMKNDPELKEYDNQFEILSPAFKRFDLFSPISLKRPDAHEIIDAFNKALREMKQDGTYSAILKRFKQQ